MSPSKARDVFKGSAAVHRLHNNGKRDESIPGLSRPCQINTLLTQCAGQTVGHLPRTVRGGVATAYESLLLQLKDGRLTYSAHSSGQTPTDFRATDMSTGRVRFEAPEHDFPQAIEYERTSPDSLTARVYGEIGSSEPAFVLRDARRGC